MSELRVAVISGGPSAEAEVSRSSARGVSEALRRLGHAVTDIELDRDTAARLTAGNFDVVFPVTHGPLGEDGCLQGLLEVLDLPYIGSQVLASALSASKPHAKARLAALGLPVAKEALLTAADATPARIAELRAALGAKLVVKPASGGSAIGVEIIEPGASPADALKAVERALVFEATLLVEPFVPGLEVTCGVIEMPSPRALPPTWIRPKAAGHYDFVSKYRPGGSEHVCPAPFSASLNERIQSAAVAAHSALGCRDLSRTDFLVETEGEGRFTLLEVNTLPGMTPTSLFPEAAAAAGISFETLCETLVQRARRRRRRAQSGVALP